MTNENTEEYDEAVRGFDGQVEVCIEGCGVLLHVSGSNFMSPMTVGNGPFKGQNHGLVTIYLRLEEAMRLDSALVEAVLHGVPSDIKHRAVEGYRAYLIERRFKHELSGEDAVLALKLGHIVRSLKDRTAYVLKKDGDGVELCYREDGDWMWFPGDICTRTGCFFDGAEFEIIDEEEADRMRKEVDRLKANMGWIGPDGQRFHVVTHNNDGGKE